MEGQYIDLLIGVLGGIYLFSSFFHKYFFRLRQGTQTKGFTKKGFFRACSIFTILSEKKLTFSLGGGRLPLPLMIGHPYPLDRAQKVGLSCET